MKIILSGGGTIGSVTPLLAITENFKNEQLLFVGTKTGPEKELVENKGLKYKAIISGKLRRYWDIKNIIDIFKIKIACWQSLFLLIKEKPDIIITAGSFVSVPLVWAGWILHVPSIVHSQDIKTGLAIMLMKPFAKKITKVFPNTDLKAECIGNPSRALNVTTNIFKLKHDLPTILITGGGTGAAAINNLVSKELLEYTQVIHITGKNKNKKKLEHKNYYVFEFLEEAMIEALNKADLVITRAGLGTLTELSILKKPCIIIPIPNSHQELNAQYFLDHNAAIVLNQKDLDIIKFNNIVKNLLNNKTELDKLKESIGKIIKPNANEKIIKIIQDSKKCI